MGGGGFLVTVIPAAFAGWAIKQREMWLRTSTDLSDDEIQVAAQLPLEGPFYSSKRPDVGEGAEATSTGHGHRHLWPKAK